MEILKPNRFVTACMSFAHDQVNESKQQLFEYPHALLASFTCDVDMWLDFALHVMAVEKVELSADSDFPCLSIRFQDHTDLTVVTDPWLTFRADYSRWKAGNQKVLKRWPVFGSDGMRQLS